MDVCAQHLQQTTLTSLEFEEKRLNLSNEKTVTDSVEERDRHPDKPVKTVETLNGLIKELHRVFESDLVDVDHVTQLMLSYKSNPAEWRKYAKFDRYRYTRNLVDEGNGKFNLMILCWGEGHASAIHDHADAHCFMKMLKGELEETRYAWPECHDPNVKTKALLEENGGCKQNDGANDIWEINQSNTKCKMAPHTDDSCCEKNRNPDNIIEKEAENEESMVELGRTRLETNGVCYINDSLGLHRVENPSHVDPAVSLHLYCPPFNACHIFNQNTGHKTIANVTFWSKFGQKRNKEIQDSRAPEDN